MASARYNGFRLPLLPAEVAEFPVVYINKSTAWKEYTLNAVPQGGLVDADGRYLNWKDYISFKRWRLPTPYEYGIGDEWEYDGTQEYTGIFVDEIIWSNATLYHEDGSVFLEGTDPIINADESFMLGIAAGLGLKGWYDG